MIDLAEQDPQLDLKKRARRRLVGAAALALLAAIVLPLVMDQEPKPVGPDIQIRIPSQEAGGASLAAEKPVALPVGATPVLEPVTAAARVPAVAPVLVAPPPSLSAPVAKPPEAKAEPKPKSETKSETKSEAQAELTATHTLDAAAEQARAEAILNGTPAQPVAGSSKYVVQLGVFGDAGNVKKVRERIKSQGYNSFTETIKADKGMKTRVRAGPFTSRDAALKARDRLKQHLGIDGIVAEK
jgi:DedD protein